MKSAPQATEESHKNGISVQTNERKQEHGKGEIKEMSNVTYYKINEEAARRAKEMNSFYEYKPGRATEEYRTMVDKAAEIAEAQKKHVDPMYHEKIDSLLDTYARKLAENMNNGYAIDARVPSVMIAGPANFPTRKKEKQNSARERNMQEWRDIQELLNKIRGVGTGGISADDPGAVEKLKKKLENLEELQETMKFVNDYYRKNGTLDKCPFLTPEQNDQLKSDMESKWHYGKAPYLQWQFTNNGAEIRRVKKRIEELEHKAEAIYAGLHFDGVYVEPDKEDNRLRIFFDEKPDEEIRTILKSNGFKWSPKANAWQRQITANAFYAADHIACIQPITGEKPSELQGKG
ncbi:MAG: DUF3560 domain-containing protein [Lachnospiraceae bacterium]|nr:DUF3560 domain-containing protein [Lachnospiraceae bacterium]